MSSFVRLTDAPPPYSAIDHHSSNDYDRPPASFTATTEKVILAAFFIFASAFCFAANLALTGAVCAFVSLFLLASALLDNERTFTRRERGARQQPPTVVIVENPNPPVLQETIFFHQPPQLTPPPVANAILLFPSVPQRGPSVSDSYQGQLIFPIHPSQKSTRQPPREEIRTPPTSSQQQLQEASIPGQRGQTTVIPTLKSPPIRPEASSQMPSQQQLQAASIPGQRGQTTVIPTLKRPPQ